METCCLDPDLQSVFPGTQFLLLQQQGIRCGCHGVSLAIQCCLVFTCLPESSLCANVGVKRDNRVRLEVGNPDKPAHPGGL